LTPFVLFFFLCSICVEVAESFWDNVEEFAKLDPKGKDGNELDEFNSHRVLETYDETLSVVKMREALVKKTTLFPPPCWAGYFFGACL
jgi:hypothetical protein